MPRIDEIVCNKCGYTIHRGWGGQFYYLQSNGKRLTLWHPGEFTRLIKYYNKDRGKETGSLPSSAGYEFMKTGTPETLKHCTGFISDCLCLDCLTINHLDLRDEDVGWRHIYYSNEGHVDDRECGKCGSKKVKTVLELLGESCPKCNEGIFEVQWTGLIT